MYVLRHYLVPYIQRSFTVTATFINLYKVLWSILKEHETKSHLEWYPVWSGLDSKHPSIPHKTCDHTPSHTCLRDVLDSSTQYMKPTTQRWVAVKKHEDTEYTCISPLQSWNFYWGLLWYKKMAGMGMVGTWKRIYLGKQNCPIFCSMNVLKNPTLFFSWHTF